MNSGNLRTWLSIAGLVASGAGCSVKAPDEAETTTLGSKTQAVSDDDCDNDEGLEGDPEEGEDAFFNVVEGVPASNDRSCGTCHVEDEGTALSPANVAARPANDPLFNALDADDPNAEVLTFNNLKAGLVRVTLTLPDNTDLVPIPPVASMFTPPDISAQILALWQASIVPGTKLGDPMPPDVDLGNGVVIHFQPEIITPADRKISVWRAVPSVANTAYTKPFLFDGRADTLQEQALGALQAHSQLDGSITLASAPYDLRQTLEDIAAFEKGVFSDKKRTPWIAKQVEKLDKYRDESLPVGPNGKHPKCDPENPSLFCLSKIDDPELKFPPTHGMSPQKKASWAAGKVVYDNACAVCHGSATDNRIINRDIHDGLFLALDPNGNLIYDPTTDGNGNTTYAPRRVPRPNSEAINIGTTFISHVGQLAGAQGFPLFNNQNGVVLPQYRMRFYTDGTRTTKVVDLPPLPVVSGGAPFTPAADPNKPGALIVGPNLGPELFSTDPGRALISGDWADFEGVDVPQLRGIAKTAPYFHDHSAADLPTMITMYSQLILPFVPQLDPFFPPVVPGTDRLTPQQKADLLTFLEVF